MPFNQDSIVKDDNPVIRSESKPVALPLSKEDGQLLADLFHYVKDSTDPEKAKEENLRAAVGISAIQVGVPKQLTAVIVNDTDNDGNPIHFEYMLANPKIVSSSIQKAYLENGEGCLSVLAEHEGYVVRSARIKVKAYDALSQKDVMIRARGYFAIVLQHEIDHFHGVLFYDHIDPKHPFPDVHNAMVI